MVEEEFSPKLRTRSSELEIVSVHTYYCRTYVRSGSVEWCRMMMAETSLAGKSGRKWLVIIGSVRDGWIIILGAERERRSYFICSLLQPSRESWGERGRLSSSLERNVIQSLVEWQQFYLLQRIKKHEKYTFTHVEYLLARECWVLTGRSAVKKREFSLHYTFNSALFQSILRA